MSYDLHFWREDTATGRKPVEVRDLLLEGNDVPQLATWPIEGVKAAFHRHFPDIDDQGVRLWWEGDNSYFYVEFRYADEKQVQMISVSCGWKLLDSPDTMNRIIDVGHSLGCALYDPQVDERFEQPN